MSTIVYGWVAGISTLVSMLTFRGVVAGSYSRRREVDFAAAAQLPLEEDAGIKSGAQS